MQHIGIDLGGRKSQICVRSTDGKILQEDRVETQLLGSFLAGQPKSRVVMESCAEAFKVASLAQEAGHETRVVPATLVRTLGVGARGVKTDKRDARVQSEVSSRIDLPSIHIPSAEAQDLRTRLQMRELIVGMQTQLVNSVRGFLRGQLLRVKGRGNTKIFIERVRFAAEEALGEVPEHLNRQLVLLAAVGQQVVQANRELQEFTKQHRICKLLMTAPYVGPVTAARFVAAIDDVTRFSNAHVVEAYLGLTPGENSSSDRIRRTGISKAGPASVRACLVQCAWGILRMGNDPLHDWGAQVAKRRNKHVAVCALARKLAGILYAMWRDNRSYQPERAADPVI